MNGGGTRRVVVQALAAAGAGAALAACAGGQPAGGDAGGGAPALKPGTLSLMSWDAPGEELERNLNAFSARHPGLKVEYLHTPAGQPYTDKFTAMLAGGSPPQVFLYSLTDWVALQAQGVLAELDPFIKRDRLDTQDFFEKALALGQWQGKQYGIGDNLVYTAMFYNRTHFQKAGATPPAGDWKDSRWTWPQFLEDANRLAKLEVDGRPVYGMNMGTGFTNLFPWVWNNGGDFFSKDLSTTTITQPPAVEALQFVADWRHKHRFAPTADVLAQENQVALYRQGRLAMWWDGPWSMQALRQVQGLDWDVAPIPRGSASRLMYASGACWFITRQNALPEESWALHRHLISKEGQLSMLKRFGFPGSLQVGGARAGVPEPAPAGAHPGLRRRGRLRSGPCRSWSTGPRSDGRSTPS